MKLFLLLLILVTSLPVHCQWYYPGMMYPGMGWGYPGMGWGGGWGGGWGYRRTKAGKAIRTGQTTCAKYERDILLEMVEHQRFSKLKEDTFGLNDTNHFDQTDFRRKDLGSAPRESYGLDGRQTSQSYPITGVILHSHGSSHLNP
ncbi:hypothetical protein Y032_1043g3477 [Ancylostoma ceylanicum]|uniref:Uncharacterized protein n=1 Tax=Ancylostoma ceylanicum TaxID=53326 RepID=A0A016W856_9BILA|nr:hypothetical protein Y032_1043g3477 [Ancylostoma ceylanicum]